MKAAIQKDDF